MIGQLRAAPNLITLLRLAFVPFVVIAVIDGSYGWALSLFIVAGLSDAVDGTLARWLHQKTLLGQYLDPIADKLLLSSLFLVLSLMGNISWKYTVLVFSRDLCILITCAVLYATTTFRDFRPSLWGKINTFAQVMAVLLVMFYEFLASINNAEWTPLIFQASRIALWATFAFTVISGVHYIFATAYRMRHHEAHAAVK